MENYKVGTGGRNTQATMVIGNYGADGLIDPKTAVTLILGNLKSYKTDEDRATQVNYACGSTTPISINKGITKVEGVMVFNMFDVDFQSNLCKLLNAFLYLKGADAKFLPYVNFANITLAKLNSISSSYKIDKGSLKITANKYTRFTPELITFDILPQFDLCLTNETSQEIIQGCKIFASDSGVGSSSIGASTSYRFSATKIRPLALIK